MKNHLTNTYRFSLTILLLLFFATGSVANGYYSKYVTGSAITIQLSQANAPSASPSSGTYTGTQLVTLTSTSSGVSIRYTTDGTDPSSTVGTLYTGPVTISGNTTLKSIAYGPGFTDSQVSTETYIINCETPVLSPASGTYDAGQRVTMSTATTGARIYYTTDGSTPTASSTEYLSRITLNVTTTLRVIAIKPGMGNSQITTEIYTILLPVAAPTFTPAPGTYTAIQNITIASTTPGATIYYTTDGSTPTTSSTPYTGPVPVGTNLTLKAIAVNSGMTNSTVTSGNYIIQLPAATPTFTPPAGTYNSTQSVTITSATQGATIYFTTDGSTPTALSQKYTGPVTVSNTSTIKAIAVNTGMSDSPVASADYIIVLQTAAPTFTPPAGTYNSTQNITLASATPGATIYYTTDGSTPTTSSQKYTGAITISATSTIKAIAVNSGMSDSPVASADYIINLPVAAPTFTPPAGTYTTPQSVTIATSTPGATIYYTIDGTTPTTSSLQYSAPLNISVNTALNAIAIKTGMSNSAVTSGNYVIQPPVTAPQFNIPSGTYSVVQTVTITSATPGATIYYTTDGSTPTSSSPLYTGPITISSSTVIMAIAEKSGMSNSSVTSANYVIALTVATPTFTPPAGSYPSAQSVTITSATQGAIIYYTTDGSTPTTSSLQYTAPINIGVTTTLNAIAVKTGMSNSTIATAVYTIAPGSSDTDGDGVSDNEDDYPNDPTRSSNNLFPASGFGSLAFEDNWPAKADYDMNDMVIDYQFNQVTNPKNEVVEIKARIVLRAMGTTLHNGFGIELPVTSSQVTSCVVKLTNGNPVPFAGNIVTINPQGLEAGNNPKAVVILFDDGFKLFPQAIVDTVINTSSNLAWIKPDTLNMTITFAQPVDMSVFADSRVYNPFIFKDKTRNIEIHLPDFTPTSLANMNLFNTGADDYNPSIGKFYKTANNLPWALNIYEEYAYPVEKTSILDAFLHFAEWAQSNGVRYPDWYKLKDGYRKLNTMYSHP